MSGWRSVLPAAAVAFAVAQANIVNDYVDRAVDQRAGADRPLVSGELRVDQAVAAIAVTTIAALVVGTLAGPRVLLTVVGAVVSAALYSFRAKGVPVVGTLLVAALGSLPVLFGATHAFTEVDDWALATTFLVFLFFFAFELVKAVRDHDADAAMGLRTTAVAIGPRSSLRAVGALGLALLIASLVALSGGVITWLAAALYCCIASQLIECGWRDPARLGRDADYWKARLSVCWYVGAAALLL